MTAFGAAVVAGGRAVAAVAAEAQEAPLVAVVLVAVEDHPNAEPQEGEGHAEEDPEGHVERGKHPDELDRATPRYGA
jgi:hypothetical protein